MSAENSAGYLDALNCRKEAELDPFVPLSDLTTIPSGSDWGEDELLAFRVVRNVEGNRNRFHKELEPYVDLITTMLHNSKYFAATKKVLDEEQWMLQDRDELGEGLGCFGSFLKALASLNQQPPAPPARKSERLAALASAPV